MSRQSLILAWGVLASTVCAENHLINPSFDNPPFPVVDCRERNLQQVTGWLRSEQVGSEIVAAGPLAFRNGLVDVPACPRDPEGASDSIHASIELQCVPQQISGMEQTVSGFNPGQVCTFSGYWSLGTSPDVLGGPATDALAFAQIFDNADGSGDALATATLSAAPGTMTDWQPFSISGTITGEVVTVRVWILSGGGLCQQTGFHLDGCSLTAETPCGQPFADADADGDVDGTDFAVLQQCLTGDAENHPAIPSDPGLCACFNREGDDDDIDAMDVEAFMNCVTGPMVPYATYPNPLCDDAP